FPQGPTLESCRQCWSRRRSGQAQSSCRRRAAPGRAGRQDRLESLQAFDAAVASDLDLAKGRFPRLESVAAYAAADECLPHQLEHVIGRKTFALQMDVRSNGTLGWIKTELRVRDLHLRHWYGLRRVRFDVSGGRGGLSRRRVKDEIRPWQIGIRRLLIVQITLRLITGIDFYRVIANRSGGAEPCDCGAVRTGSGNETHRVVVPV